MILANVLVAVMILASLACGVIGLYLAGRAAFRLLVTPNVTKDFERYVHHGDRLVWVRNDLRGRHRDFCLCSDCRRFHPGSTGNCPIAAMLYQLCINHDLVTPVWECPRFTQDANA